MAAMFEVSLREGVLPVALHYSIIKLPPTLRAVRGCSR